MATRKLQRPWFGSSLSNLFWFICGVIAFLPMESGISGLYISYFIIPIIFLTGVAPNRLQIFLILNYTIFVTISVCFGTNPDLSSLINPIFIAICLISKMKSSPKLEFMKCGIYFAASLTALYLIWLAYQKDIDGFFVLMTSREWAIPEVPFFGNGLAMVFAIVAFFAFQEKKYSLMFLFFFGGLLTTSRMPIIFFILIMVLWGFNKFRLGLLPTVSFFLVFTFALFFLNAYDVIDFTQGQFDLIKSRFSTTEDREEAYQFALDYIINNPVFGAGSNKLDFYEHAHNSYIQALYKNGILAFICWISLLYTAFFRKLKISANLPFITIFLLVSLTQIGLQSPNIVILFVFYISYFAMRRGWLMM